MRKLNDNMTTFYCLRGDSEYRTGNRALSLFKKGWIFYDSDEIDLSQYFGI